MAFPNCLTRWIDRPKTVTTLQTSQPSPSLRPPQGSPPSSPSPHPSLPIHRHHWLWSHQILGFTLASFKITPPHLAPLRIALIFALGLGLSGCITINVTAQTVPTVPDDLETQVLEIVQNHPEVILAPLQDWPRSTAQTLTQSTPAQSSQAAVPSQAGPSQFTTAQPPRPAPSETGATQP
ncbi:MAG: hypothetical protein ACO4CG_07215 [Prochlorothrix sp.]